MRKIFLSLMLIMGITGNAYAISVDKIVKKANNASYYQGKDGKAKVEMSITDASGKGKRSRNFTILRKDIEDKSDGTQKFYVYFNRPADVNKTAFLVWKNLDKDDDRWLYLPALDLVKRIAASDGRTSFVGSHFFYEDVSGRGIDKDTHELLEETDTYYIIKSTPKNKNSAEFSYYKNWIHKATFIPVKTEYYNSNNKVYRTYEALAVEDVDGFKTVTKSKMTDNNIGGSTTMTYSKVEYNIGLDEKIFSERYLREPPRKYLR